MNLVRLRNKFNCPRRQNLQLQARAQINFLAWATAAAVVMVSTAWLIRQTEGGKPSPTEHVSAALAQALAAAGQKEKVTYATKFAFTRFHIERTDFGGVWGATLTFGLKNNGDRAVTGIKVTISLMDTNGVVCHQEPFTPFYDRTNDPMIPGQSWGTDENNPVIIPSLPDSWQGGYDYIQVTDVQFLDSK